MCIVAGREMVEEVGSLIVYGLLDAAGLALVAGLVLYTSMGLLVVELYCQ